MEEVTETIIVVALMETEVELVRFFLERWDQIINLDDVSDEIIENLKECVGSLKNKLGIED